MIGKEDADRHHKDLDVVLGSERTAIIIDDTPAVWPQQAAQILVPRRYHFFGTSAVNASLRPIPHTSHPVNAGPL